MINPADILTLVKTKDEANEFQKQLDNLLSVLFTDASFEKILQDHISYEKQQKLLTLLSKNQINTTKQTDVQNFVQEIKKIIAQTPVVEITIAFSPQQQLMEMIATWFLVNAKKIVLLQIVINKNLIGGAIIQYKGISKDYSLKKILEEKYEKGDLSLKA